MTARGRLFSSNHAVPRVLELSLQDAQRRITALGFRARFAATGRRAGVPAGRVVGQDPPPGVVLPPGSAVQLITSGSRTPVIVPDAAGRAAATVDSVTDGADAPGVVIARRPAAGASEDAGTTIGLVVSVGGVGRP